MSEASIATVITFEEFSAAGGRKPPVWGEAARATVISLDHFRAVYTGTHQYRIHQCLICGYTDQWECYDASGEVIPRSYLDNGNQLQAYTPMDAAARHAQHTHGITTDMIADGEARQENERITLSLSSGKPWLLVYTRWR